MPPHCANCGSPVGVTTLVLVLLLVLVVVLVVVAIGTGGFDYMEGLIDFVQKA